MKVAFVLLLSVIAAFAHDKMTQPLSRTEVETTAAVCDGPYDAARARGSVIAGTTITVNWDGNHNGVYDISIAPLAGTNDITAYNLIKTVTQVDGDAPTTQVTFPADLATGIYTMRWYWSGYVSCADFNVEAVAVDDSSSSNGAIGDNGNGANNGAKKNGGSVSGGAWAAIVIVPLAVVGMVAAAFYFYRNSQMSNLPKTFGSSNGYAAPSAAAPSAYNSSPSSFNAGSPSYGPPSMGSRPNSANMSAPLRPASAAPAPSSGSYGQAPPSYGYSPAPASARPAPSSYGLQAPPSYGYSPAPASARPAPSSYGQQAPYGAPASQRPAPPGSVTWNRASSNMV